MVQARRRQYGFDEVRVREDTVEVDQREAPDPGPGKHLWIVLGAWLVDMTTFTVGGTLHLDAENFLRVGGPGCEKCGAHYTQQVEAYPCPGKADEVTP